MPEIMVWHELRRYGFALLAVGFAILFARSLDRYIAPHVSPPYFLAVMLASAYAGAGPGLLATLIASLAIAWFDLGTVHDLHLGLDDAVRLAAFTTTALIISSISAARKAAERDLRDALERLSALDRAKDEFIATVSHELRTPLTGILGWLKILRSPDLDDATRELALASAEQSATTQSLLVNDLLDASRITFGKLHLERRPLRLRDSVIDAIGITTPAANAKHLTLEVIGSDDLSVVHGDRDRLRQVFWNLLSNAIKFSQAERRIIIRITHDDREATVSVIDEGTGIDAALLPFVFDRYAQGDTGTHRGGLGLGLEIVRHIVELHRGRVSASSEGTGRGATFSVILPVAKPVADAAFPDGVTPRA